MGAVNYDDMSPVALMAAAERLTGGEWGVNVGAEILGLSLGGEDGGDVVAVAGHLGCSSVAWGVLFEGGTVAPPLQNAGTVSRYILEHQDALRARSAQASPPSAMQEEWARGWGRHFDTFGMVVPTRVFVRADGSCRVHADKMARAIQRAVASMHRAAREFGKWADRGGAPFFVTNRQPTGRAGAVGEDPARGRLPQPLLPMRGGFGDPAGGGLLHPNGGAGGLKTPPSHTAPAHQADSVCGCEVTRPYWLPECPRGWSLQNTNDDTCIEFLRYDGATLTIRDGWVSAAVGLDALLKLPCESATKFATLCDAIGFGEWKPEPWEARVSKAIKRIGEDYDRMTDDEFAAHVESSYTGEFDGLFHGLDVGDWGGER